MDGGRDDSRGRTMSTVTPIKPALPIRQSWDLPVAGQTSAASALPLDSVGMIGGNITSYVRRHALKYCANMILVSAERW